MILQIFTEYLLNGILNSMDIIQSQEKSILRWEKKGIMEYTHATTYNSVYRCTIANWLRRKTLKVNF